MQNFINSFIFGLFVFAYIGGILLYNMIDLPGVDKIDEAYTLILFLVYLFRMFKQGNWEINKFFLITIAIFLFYFFYSIGIKSNVVPAIFMDFFIQLKPYLAFFCIYQMRPELNKEQKKILNQLSLLCWILLLPIGVAGFINKDFFKYIIGHPTSYAGAVTISSLLYLFTSKGTKTDKIVFIGLLSIGLLSGRSKFYGFFVLASAIVLYFNDIKRVKLNYKTVMVIMGVVAIILFVAQEKIKFYFMQGISGESVEKDYLARMALYVTSYTLFWDYFPFGTGFASFGTHASGVYYSSIYSEYNLDGIWGLNRTFTKFVADTYYPSLAQFGVFGLLLYALFWFYIIKKAITRNLDNQNLYLFSIILCIIGFFIIENVADAAFTGNRGVFMMFFLGYIFSNFDTNKNLKPSQI